METPIPQDFPERYVISNAVDEFRKNKERV